MTAAAAALGGNLQSTSSSSSDFSRRPLSMSDLSATWNAPEAPDDKQVSFARRLVRAYLLAAEVVPAALPQETAVEAASSWPSLVGCGPPFGLASTSLV